jgi:hypothetical protein
VRSTGLPADTAWAAAMTMVLLLIYFACADHNRHEHAGMTATSIVVEECTRDAALPVGRVEFCPLARSKLKMSKRIG